jgi:pimeloyl-ACP methyl ester carboxylesterase
VISLADWHAGGERVAILGHGIFVRQDGPPEGIPVTMIHGFPTSSHDWTDVLPYLVDAGCRVTTLDLLGFGASDKPRPYDYSLLEQASVVAAVWADLGITKTALVAHDYGVSVAQELLARDSGRMTTMTWLNGGLYPDLHRPTRGQKALAGRLGAVVARRFTEARFAAALREILGRPVSDVATTEMWLALQLRNGALVTPALLGYMAERRTNERRWVDALEGYAGPQHFIWGPADPVSGDHVATRIAARLPHARLSLLDQPPPVGHYPQVEAPELVGPLLVDGVNGR